MPDSESKFHTLYFSRRRELVIEVEIETDKITIKHDLLVGEVPKLRLRAINTLKERLPEFDEIIAKYAPGAETRKKAERDKKGYLEAIKAIEKLWPEEQFGSEPPTADRVIPEIEHPVADRVDPE